MLAIPKTKIKTTISNNLEPIPLVSLYFYFSNNV